MAPLPFLHVLALLSVCVAAKGPRDSGLIRMLGPQGVNLVRLGALNKPAPQLAKARADYGANQEVLDPKITERTYDFRAQWFEQPLDHFDEGNGHRWHQRFWVNSRHYKPGTNAPVIVLDGGETSGEVGFRFIVTGWELMGHRTVYRSWTLGLLRFWRRRLVGLVLFSNIGITVSLYLLGDLVRFLPRSLAGESIPVSNFSTDSLRFA